MRQKFFLFFLIISLVGCSNDDNATTSTQTVVLPKKITETVYSSFGTDVSVGNFNYENNVLKSVEDGTKKLEFVYDGNKIIRTNTLNNNVVVSFCTYVYEGDNLKTIQRNSNDEKTVFGYENGILKTKTSYLSSNSDPFETITYTFNSSLNIVSNIIHYTETVDYTTKETYTYDVKNNPMKNMNPYVKFVMDFESFSPFTMNNKLTQSNYNPVDAATPSSIINYEIIYDQNNFPLEIKKIRASTNTLISKIVIEYN